MLRILKSLDKFNLNGVFLFRIGILFLLIILSFVVVGYLFNRLVYVGMQSVRPHVFFFKTDERNFFRYDFVMVRGKSGDRFTAGHLLTKKVGCLPGDILAVFLNSSGKGMFYCCPRENFSFEKLEKFSVSSCFYMGESKTYSVKYRTRLYAYYPCSDPEVSSKYEETIEIKKSNGTVEKVKKCISVIPEKEYFLYTDSKDSYDSRYMGLFEESEILYKLKPVF